MTQQARHVTAGRLSSTSGQVDIDLKTGSFVLKGPAGNITLGDLESGDVVARIDAGSEVESFQIGSVTLYGELACKVREVQEILTAHGAGELKVVKPEAEVALADPRKFEVNSKVKAADLGSSLKVMAGLISESTLGEALLENIERIGADAGFASDIRQVIREELRPGGLLHRH